MIHECKRGYLAPWRLNRNLVRRERAQGALPRTSGTSRGSTTQALRTHAGEEYLPFGPEGHLLPADVHPSRRSEALARFPRDKYVEAAVMWLVVGIFLVAGLLTWSGDVADLPNSVWWWAGIVAVAALCFLYEAWSIRKPSGLRRFLEQSRAGAWCRINNRQALSIAVVLFLALCHYVLATVGIFAPERGLALQEALALDVEAVFQGELWRLVTTGFVHANLLHVAVNAFALWFLGWDVETLFSRPILAGALVAGLLGGSFALMISPPEYPAVGASGAILALPGLLLGWAIACRRGLPPGYLRMGLAMMAVIILVEAEMTYVAHMAHLGGLIAGVALGIALAWRVGPRAFPRGWLRALQGLVTRRALPAAR